jgi:hypothetical protein
MTILGRQGTTAFDGAITPLFLILLPLLLFLRRKERVVLSLGMVGLIEFAAWALVPRGYHQSRHLIPTFPLFSLLVAYVVCRLPEFDRPWFSLSGFFRLVLILVLGIQTISMATWRETFDSLPYVLGMETRTTYLARHLNSGWSPGYFDMMRVINRTLPHDSTVGFVDPEARVYYCQCAYVKFPFRYARTVEEMAAAAEDQGLTHLLVSWKGIAFFLNEHENAGNEEQVWKWSSFSDTLHGFLDEHAALEYQVADSMSLYRVGVRGQ